MHKKVRAFLRGEIKINAKRLNEEQELLFRKLFAGGDTNMFDDVVDSIPDDKLEAAMDVVDRTLVRLLPMKYSLYNGIVVHPSHPATRDIVAMTQEEVVSKLNGLTKENFEMGRTIARYLTQCCVCGCTLELPDELAHCEDCVGDTTDYGEDE